MFCIPNGLKGGQTALRAVVFAIVCLMVWTPGPLSAQEASGVLERLGIPATRLAEIPEQGLGADCRPGAGATVCEVRFNTTSDEVCRAVAVREALRYRSSDAPAVVARVTCSSGIVAVFQAGARRGVMSYKDARGNTARREFPM